jgi:hypothetical protein
VYEGDPNVKSKTSLSIVMLSLTMAIVMAALGIAIFPQTAQAGTTATCSGYLYTTTCRAVVVFDPDYCTGGKPLYHVMYADKEIWANGEFVLPGIIDEIYTCTNYSTTCYTTCSKLP